MVSRLSNPILSLLFGCTLWWILNGSGAVGQEFNERFSDWPVDLKINGRVVVAGALSDINVLAQLLGRSASEQKLLLSCPVEFQDDLQDAYSQIFDEVELVHWQAGLSGDGDFDAVAWHAPSDLSLGERIDATHAATLADAAAQGKTLILIGPGARYCSKVYLTNDAAHPAIELGLNLLPDCVLSFSSNQDDGHGRVLSVLASQKQCVGVELDNETALMLSGRKIMVAGQGGATFLLMGNERTPVRKERIVQRLAGERPSRWLIDLTEWRRDAIDRTLEPFPSEHPKIPFIEKGTLFIVGGGGMPAGLEADFVEAAGGVENARLVYIPCEEDEMVSERQSMVERWKNMGVEQATFMHTKDRVKANTDDEFLLPLVDATGIWFGGGRQWNFADSYYGTRAHRLMKEVLKRGGVVGGSSAGASIQGRYLARATPIENFRIMAPGYERGGLGFLDGVAIDQHFSQRGRHKDMSRLVDRYPQLLGIGIDEATAIIVKGSQAEVVGRGKVHFYDRALPVVPDRPDYIEMNAGDRFDLAKRKPISGAATSAKDDADSESDVGEASK